MSEWFAAAGALALLALSGQATEIGEIGKRCPAPVVQVMWIPC